MDNRPNESIFGTLISLVEVGLRIYLYVTRDKKCGIKMSAETAKESLSPEMFELGKKTDSETNKENSTDMYFEGESANKVCQELLKRGLITDEKFKEAIEENPELFEEMEYFPPSDFEFGIEDYELGSEDFEI